MIIQQNLLSLHPCVEIRKIVIQNRTEEKLPIRTLEYASTYVLYIRTVLMCPRAIYDLASIYEIQHTNKYRKPYIYTHLYHHTSFVVGRTVYGYYHRSYITTLAAVRGGGGASPPGGSAAAARAPLPHPSVPQKTTRTPSKAPQCVIITRTQ